MLQLERILSGNRNWRQESVGSRQDHGAILQVEDQGAAAAFEGPSTTGRCRIPSSDELDVGIGGAAKGDRSAFVLEDGLQLPRPQPVPEEVQIVDGEVSQDAAGAMRGCPAGAQDLEPVKDFQVRDVPEEDPPRGIVALDHAACQNPTSTSERGQEGHGLVEGRAHRLLDQDVQIVPEAAHGVRKVALVGRADQGAIGVHDGEEFVQGAGARNAMLVDQGVMAPEVALHDADELEARATLHGLEMMGSHSACADKDRPRC